MVGQITSKGSSVAGGATNYVQWNGCSGSWLTQELRVQQVMPCAGSWSYLRVVLNVAPGGSDTRAFTLRKAAGATALACTVSAGATTAQDTTNSVSVVAGDLIGMQQVVSATAAAASVTGWCAKFTAANANEFPLLWGDDTVIGATTTKYAPYQGDGALQASSIAPLSVDYLAAAPIPCAGTVTAIYAHGDAAQVSATLVATLFVNGSTSGLAATINTSATAGNNTGSVAVNAGDLLSVEIANGGTNTPRMCIGLLFKPTTDGQSVAMFVPPGFAAQNTTRFMNFSGGGVAWSATEGPTQSPLIACTVQNLYYQANPAITTVSTATVRKNAASQTLTAAVTGIIMAPPVAANDTTHTFTAVDDDLLSLQQVTGSLTGNVTSQGAVVLAMTQPTTSTLIGASNIHYPSIGVA